MRALVFDLDQRLHLRNDYAAPARTDETLVKVRRAGICNTDLEITKGYANFHGVLGHEFVGELADGTRVVGEINAYDGTCPTCRRGDTTHCENRTVLGIINRDGAMAEFLTLPARNLHRVPGTVSDRQAVFVEPLAAALEIAERVHIRPSARVAIIGEGKLGQLCAQVLNLTGCDLLVIGRHQRKLDLLARRGIATTREPEKLAREFDVVVDCAGQASGFELARKLLRARGTLILKSTIHDGQSLHLAPVAVDEISIIGSRCGPFGPALRLLEKGLVDVESLIDGEYPLARGLEAFEHAQTAGTLKIQLVTE